MLGLYHETMEERDQKNIQILKGLEEEIRKNHPCLNFSWFVRFGPSGLPTVKIQILGIESHYLIPDAMAAFRRLAGSK
jgi:hypothetical protein